MKYTNPKKASILWISFFQARGLDRSSLSNILNQLAKLGHEVSLVTMQDKIETTKNTQVRIISIPLRRTPLVLPAIFAFILFFYLPILTTTSKTDFIIMEPSVHILSAFPQLVLSKFRKVKFILDIRSTPVETEGLRGSLLKFWFSVSILTAKKKFRGITIITPLMKEKVCNDYGLDPDKVGVWTSGVSDTLFNPETWISEGAKLKERLRLHGKFVVFYHGVFTPTRGLIETAEAVRALRSRYPDIVFFLLGSGPLFSKLGTLVQEEGLQENVIVANPVDHSEVPKYISMSNVGIVPLPDHPYWRMQSPLKLLEYLAMEKVAILTNLPAHRAVTGDEKCGIYLSSVNPTKIAEKIEYAYLNRPYLTEWGKVGRQIVKQRYTWEKVADSLETYLQSIDN